MVLNIFKVIFLAITIFFTTGVIIKTYWKDCENIIPYILCHTIGTVGFITLQFNLIQ